MKFGSVLALVLALVFVATPVSANHKNPSCMMPEEVLDEIASNVPVELKLAKFDRADALSYVAALFKLTGGGKPPFDLSKVKGGVVIYSSRWPKVYAGVIDGPKGEVCHATVIPMGLHTAIMAEIEKGKA